ncbi:hypothetical protein ACFXTH_003476 [Malus domestica]
MLPHPHLFRPYLLYPKFAQSNIVSSLTDYDSARWNYELIHSLFGPPEDVALTLSIPLSFRFPLDRLIWHLDSKGVFSVKSAYKAA